MTRLQALGVGMNVLADWLGEGRKPVPQEQADARASVCASCPHNWDGDWFNKLSGNIVAIVMQQRRAKVGLGLHVKDEALIHFCEVCQCHLPVKVHVPLRHIEDYTPEQVWRELPQECWMKKERGH